MRMRMSDEGVRRLCREFVYLSQKNQRWTQVFVEMARREEKLIAENAKLKARLYDLEHP